jgi:squalene synthase HpnC
LTTLPSTPENAAYKSCARQARQHYENFPVASMLLPRALRRPVAAIYAFARSADDIADEGDLDGATRLALLDAYRRNLERIEQGGTPDTALFTALADTIRTHALPLQPFYDLLAAFRQDVTQTRYADFDELSEYCRRSANPVGRLLLRLFHRDDAANIALSDAVCTGLQLTNFLQDVCADFERGRIYLPQAALRAHGVTPDDIPARRFSPGWQRLIDGEIGRARSLLLRGARLGGNLTGRIGLEIRLTIAGGLTILDKLQAINRQRFVTGARLTPLDWLRILWRSHGIR